jgi:Tfp pilus assembly protein PilN
MNFSGSNFQIWPDFDLEISGLTVIVGPSNKGKSALFRALKGLMRNELSAAYVRNGQKSPLELTTKIDNHLVTAIRTRDDSSVYRIDGERFAKLNQAIPDDIKKLGFGEIQVGEFSVDPIFATQNEPQFLLDKKAYGPSLLNAVLGAFGGTEKLESGKKEANLRVRQKNGEADALSYEIADAHRRRAALEVLAQEGDQINAEIHVLESSARRLEARGYWMSEAHQRRLRLSPMLEILGSLLIPETEIVGDLQTKVDNLRLAAIARGRLESLGDVEQFLADISSSGSYVVGLYKKVRALREVSPLVELQEVSTAEADAKELNAIIGRLEDVHYEAINLQASIRYIGNVVTLRARVAELQHERSHVEAEQDAASKMKCPQCGLEF